MNRSSSASVYPVCHNLNKHGGIDHRALCLLCVGSIDMALSLLIIRQLHFQEAGSSDLRLHVTCRNVTLYVTVGKVFKERTLWTSDCASHMCSDT